MFAQLKYSSRIFLGPRLIALLVSVAVSLAVYALGATGLLPIGWVETASVFAGLCFMGLFAVNVIADVESYKSLFSAPGGYNALLTPVKGWKIILGRVLVMTVFDLASLLISGSLIAMQFASMSSYFSTEEFFRYGSNDVVSTITGTISYMILLLLIVFACALSKSLLFSLRVRGLLACVVTCAVIYLSGFLNLLLTPFADVVRVKAFISVHLTAGWNSGTIAYIVLLLVEAAALLIASSYLYERKVNL